MNKLPSRFVSELPAVLQALAGVGWLFALGCQADPELAGTYGLTSAGVSALVQALGAFLGRNVAKASAAALPESLTKPDGRLDQVAVIATLIADAYRRGNADLVGQLKNLNVVRNTVEQ